MEYRVGQILTSKKELVIESAISGTKTTVPKGNKIVIGADGFAHHIRGGYIQPLGEDAKVEGYDTNGLAEYLYLHLCKEFEINDMLDSYDETKERFIEEIEYALSEIGF